MADLSLGPLRIANPDNASASASPESSLQAQTPGESAAIISPLSVSGTQQDYVTQPEPRRSNPGTPTERSPQTPTAPPITSASANTSQNFVQKPRQSDRQAPSQNMAYTYQDQQQAQFPQYPTMMPQNLHDPRSFASRPGSTYYTQVPINGQNSNGASRQSSYRTGNEPALSSIPQRSGSKRAAPMVDAGVPSRDDTHSERLYGQTRRTSRAAGTARLGNTPTGNSPLSNTPLSSSPYALEPGPLSAAEEWQEKGAAVAIKRDHDADGRPILKTIKKGVKDFNFGQTLGEGSYSTVLAAQDRQTLKDYAIKVLDKRHIIKEKKVKYVNIERDTLNRLTDHPGVVRLYYTFQDERSLYYVLDLCTGGELLGVLKRMTTFDEECSRFYCAQILDTIAYMHNRGVIHRDLKPENVLLDENKHIKITDFGTAKLLPEHRDASGKVTFESDSSSMDSRASSFVGTAEYVSPELLTDKNACKASDLWAFGCIVYQLLAGRPPFKAANEYLTFQKIVALEYDFPRGFPEVARDLVERLLVLDPNRRLTIEHIRNHEFFDGIKWGRGLWSQPAPRLKAYVPPPNPLIKLNGNNASQEGYSRDMTPSHSVQATILPPNNSKPHSRVVTELPPPSQLDIEWSPVLTRDNERILKLGNLSVLASQGPSSPGEGSSKLSRFFSGNNSKKRERLVMVTSSGRLIIAPAGGEEKKAKYEIGLLSPGTEYSSSTDAKGITQWVVNTRDRCFTFEDPKAASREPLATTVSAQEWLDALVRARDLAISLQERNNNNNYSTDDSLNISSSALSSHASTLDQSTELTPHTATHSGRAMLHKQQSGGDAESLKGRKRFSKRQSKSGLQAVF